MRRRRNKKIEFRNLRKGLRVFVILITGLIALTPDNLIATTQIGNATPTKVYYAESWKKGSRQIKEQKLLVKLDRKKTQYSKNIEDISGRIPYRLQVKFREKYVVIGRGCVVGLHSLEDNLGVMAVSRGGGGDSFPRENSYGAIYAIEEDNVRKTGYSGAPLSAKRVFKIENFYCVIQVKSYQLNPKEWRYIESIEVEIEFTNTYRPEWKNAEQ